MFLKRFFSINRMHKMALLAIWIGALCSLALVLYKGRHNDSVLLDLLFSAWVLLPFITLLAAARMAWDWADFARFALYLVMIFISIGSLIGYSGALNSSRTKPAFVFIVIPLISWLLIVIVIPLAISVSRRTGKGK